MKDKFYYHATDLFAVGVQNALINTERLSKIEKDRNEQHRT